ncbi:MAG TPA: DUF5777 family beta-barrel protein [Bacteroidia bacterium]|jgi:hypothetical protein|nr:DUF5777 family beta-barrel protein [Bacteroidia bacterium]
MVKRFLFISLFYSFSLFCFAQSAKDTTHKKAVPAAWNDVRLISSPTTKTVAPGLMEVYFMHRLGSMGGASNGGFHTLYGFDIASDVLFGFDFGISKRLMVGFSRSKAQELVDVYGKYKILDQKAGGSPVSIAVNGDIGITPEDTGTLYKQSSEAESRRSIADRLTYLGQIIIGSRINQHISLEIVPTLCHRNHVLEVSNTNNDTYDENDIPAIGVGGRYMFNKTIGVVADYYYIISKYRTNNPFNNYYNALSCGIELNTGGHVFEINLSNASGLVGNNFIPNTKDTWLKGGFKLGFTISRAFNL